MTIQVSEAVVERTQEVLVEKLDQRAIWISQECWETAIPRAIRKLGETISAACELGATRVSGFTSEEIKGLAKTLRPMRRLGMCVEAEEILFLFLNDKGLEAELVERVKERMQQLLDKRAAPQAKSIEETKADTGNT